VRRAHDRDAEVVPSDNALSPAARVFRAAHTAIALGFLGAIAHVWRCALTGHRDRLLRVALATLAVEGTVVAANGGDCPLGGLQERVGDPIPLFELVLPPRAAKLAVPALGSIAALGAALALRPRTATSGEIPAEQARSRG
jgi:hypothetical protein